MGERLCLRWNKFPGSMAVTLGHLQEQGELIDVTLACRGGKVFSAHKVVLAACSPYFREMLKSTPCEHPIFFLKDVCPEEMEALIHFMYRGQTSIDQNKLAVLLQAAEALQIKGLADVSGLSYDDLDRGDVGSTETATCTHQTRGTETQLGGNGRSRPKAVPQKRTENPGAQGKGVPQPPAKKRKQLPVLHSIIAKDPEDVVADAEPKDLTVRTNMDTETSQDVTGFTNGGSHRGDSEKENIDSNVSSVKSENFDMDGYDDDMDGHDESRYMASSMVEVSTGSPTSGSLYCHEAISSSEPKSPLLAIDPEVLSSNPSLSAAAKLRELASTVTSSDMMAADSPKISTILATPMHGDVPSLPRPSQPGMILQLSTPNGADATPRKLAFHEPRPCPVCKRIYRDAATLRTHTAIMHTEGTTPFFCSCGSAFRTKYEMYIHKKNGHKPTGDGGSLMAAGIANSVF